MKVFTFRNTPVKFSNRRSRKKKKRKRKRKKKKKEKEKKKKSTWGKKWVTMINSIIGQFRIGQ